MGSMAKDKTIYTCTECGGTSPKWLGKCPACGAWNTLIESVADSASAGKNRLSQPQGLVQAAAGHLPSHLGLLPPHSVQV